MHNDYLTFYGEHQISPVSQNIHDLDVHYERRKKLYRQCGIPLLAFRNANILEIGPGGGYNTLAFFYWGCAHVDLVEANATGISNMQALFKEQHILQEKYEIFPGKIENYQTDKKYDMIIAEGFLQFLPNQQIIIDKMKELANQNGIIVITCSDHVCLFVELMKRLIGWALTKDMQQYEDKLACLIKFYEPQLSALKGMSRSAKDWVEDMMINPATSNCEELSMAQAICYFEKEYDILGSSPKIFTDYSWYKDIWYDYKKEYKNQFEAKRLSLLMTNTPEISLSVTQIHTLVKHFEAIKKLAADYEKDYASHCITDILYHMEQMNPMIYNIDHVFVKVFDEIRAALAELLQTGTTDLEKYPHFKSAFGRTQQYIAFMKK